MNETFLWRSDKMVSHAFHEPLLCIGFCGAFAQHHVLWAWNMQAKTSTIYHKHRCTICFWRTTAMERVDSFRSWLLLYSSLSTHPRPWLFSKQLRCKDVITCISHRRGYVSRVGTLANPIIAYILLSVVDPLLEKTWCVIVSGNDVIV